MNIYENNKQLLTTMGGDSYNLATDFEVRKAILDLLGGDSSNCNSIYEVDLQILNIYLEGGGGTGGDITLSPITITENGVYTAGVGNGYDEVTVNVEIPECPEIPLTAITINSNGTYIPEEGGYNEVIVDVAGGGGGAVGEKLKVKQIRFSNSDVVNGTIDMDNVYNHIDFSETIYASEMFAELGITTLDLTNPNFDTSKVIDMRDMFAYLNRLTQLDLSNLNVSNVTTMDGMFRTCEALQSVGDLSNWDVSKVTNMSNMFWNCLELTNLDLSNWDVKMVDSMGAMFYNCVSLKSVGDLSNWDTGGNLEDGGYHGGITGIGQMFCGCSSLTQLNVTNWETNAVGDMYETFCNCSSLTQLDLTNWDAASVGSIDNFSAGSGIINYVGGRTIDDVIANNITILDAFRCNASGIMSAVADRASLRALINGLLTVPQDEGDPEYGLYDSIGLYQSNLDTLTEEDIAVSTEKGWTLWAFE